jgi:hypothetical protein
VDQVAADHIAENDQAGVTTAPRESKSRRLWIFLGAFCLASTLALGLLDVLGRNKDPARSFITALALLAAFLLGVRKFQGEELAQESKRARFLYVASAPIFLIILLGAGWALRTSAPIPHMSGTADVAVIGFRAPSPSQQQQFDDLAASLAKALPTPADGEVRDYTKELDVPISDLWSPGGVQKQDSWLGKFLLDSGAELVVAGYAEVMDQGQIAVHVGVFVPPRLAIDAPELSGWLILDDSLADRRLDSSQSRRILLEHVTEHFQGLSAFLRGLDAWEAGYPADAVAAFGEVISGRLADSSTTLQDLALLFRGHAWESQSQMATSAERNRMLRLARQDYMAVPASSRIAARARVSLATNDYLLAAESGCIKGTTASAQLLHSSEVLRRVADDGALPTLLRLTAKVNQAQVEMCRVLTGDTVAGGRLEAILRDLTGLPTPDTDLDVEAKRHIKALALSIQAIRLAEHRRYGEAVTTMDSALDLDPRFERQAPWIGLQGSWLLADCRIGEGITTQRRSLDQLRMAVEAKRLPPSELETYSKAFSSDVSDARQRC